MQAIPPGNPVPFQIHLTYQYNGRKLCLFISEWVKVNPLGRNEFSIDAKIKLDH